jgi:hypothetical protein
MNTEKGTRLESTGYVTNSYPLLVLVAAPYNTICIHSIHTQTVYTISGTESGKIF